MNIREKLANGYRVTAKELLRIFRDDNTVGSARGVLAAANALRTANAGHTTVDQIYAEIELGVPVPRSYMSCDELVSFARRRLARIEKRNRDEGVDEETGAFY